MAEQITLVTQGVSKRRDYQRAEAELLRAIRHLIRDGGFNELSMARIAEVTGYTRKTVYNHFVNIEDAVVLADILQAVMRRKRRVLYTAGAKELADAAGVDGRKIGAIVHSTEPEPI